MIDSSTTTAGIPSTMTSLPPTAGVSAVLPDPADTTFLSNILRRPVQSVEIVDMSGDGGNSGGDLRRLLVTFDSDDQRQPYVWKQTTTSTSMATSQQMGLTREAFFYNLMFPDTDDTTTSASSTTFSTTTAEKQKLQSLLPAIYYAQADLTTGAKTIVMQDLFAATDSINIQSGYLFGSHSPLNWNKNLQELTREIHSASTPSSITMQRVAQSAFRTIAVLHASFWNDSTSLRLQQGHHEWLRASDWILHHQGRDSWETLQARCATAWQTLKQQQVGSSSSGTTTASIQWDPLVVSCLNASLEKATWDTYQEELRHRPFTLVHGDFHPGNTVTRLNDNSSDDDEDDASHELSTLLFDFEMVGVGSGPQDLGQYMISHVPPAQRVAIEESLVRDYFETLCKLNGSVGNAFSWDDCWKEYVHGGLGRWLWFLPVLSAWFPAPAVQYFHDQLAHFLKTHEITPDTVPMPRV